MSFSSSSAPRRTTLGPLNMNTVGSSSRINSGKPPRMSMGIMPSAKRNSLAPNSHHSSRKSSIGGRSVGMSAYGGRNSSTASNTSIRLASDPRNIGDKSFLSNSIRTLIDFLSTHSYDLPVNIKMLTKPTGKDFNNIMVFLFRLMDYNYKCTGKFENEMTELFKFLGYPFQVAKSNLAAVGSPHAWSTLLATIMWLVELINYDESAQIGADRMKNESNDDTDDPSSSEKAFYRYLGKAYALFLSGKDDHYAKLEEQFIASFENKNVLIRDQIDAYTKRNQVLSSEIEEVKNKSAYLPQLEAKRREFQQEQSKFAQLVGELKKHRDTLRTKTEAREHELEKLKSTHASNENDIDELKTRISQQELSPDDVMNMVNERQRLEDAQQQASETRQESQRRIWELEMSLREKVQKLEDTVKAYHSMAEDLKLIPESARNSRGLSLMVEVDIRAKKREGLLKTNIRQDIIPHLNDMKTELSDVTLSLRNELLVEQDLAEEIEVKKGELIEAKETLDNRMRRAEAAYKREKETLDQATDLHGRELDAMESRLVQLRDTTQEEARINVATRRLHELNALRKNRRAEHIRKKRSMNDQITEVVSLCAEHREFVQHSLHDLKSLYTNQLEGFFGDAKVHAEPRSTVQTNDGMKEYNVPTPNMSTPQQTQLPNVTSPSINQSNHSIAINDNSKDSFAIENYEIFTEKESCIAIEQNPFQKSEKIARTPPYKDMTNENSRVLGSARSQQNMSNQKERSRSISPIHRSRQLHSGDRNSRVSKGSLRESFGSAQRVLSQPNSLKKTTNMLDRHDMDNDTVELTTGDIENFFDGGGSIASMSNHEENLHRVLDF